MKIQGTIHIDLDVTDFKPLTPCDRTAQRSQPEAPQDFPEEKADTSKRTEVPYHPGETKDEDPAAATVKELHHMVRDIFGEIQKELKEKPPNPPH